MSIKGISHIAIGVTDMDKALTFYADVLGLEKVMDHSEDIEMENIAPYKRRAAYLRWPNEVDGFVVLDEQSPSKAANPIGFNDRGMHHFAFAVDNLDTIHQRALTAGTPVMIEPCDLKADDPINPFRVDLRMVFYRDPDGNIVQLDEY